MENLTQRLKKSGLSLQNQDTFFDDAVFRICLIMVPYASIMPEYALMFPNVPEHG